MSKIIEISNGTLTSTSISLATIIIVSFIYFCRYILSRIYRKISKKDIPQHLNFKNITFYGLNEVLNSFNKTKINDLYQENIKNNITKLNSGILQKYTQNVSKNLNTNTDATNTALYGTLEKTLGSISNITTKINSIQKYQISNLETKYTNYQQQIKLYVDNLQKMLTTISDQIVKLSTNPTYNPLINPLSRIFTSIKSALVNNTDKISKFYTGYKVPSIELPDTSAVIITPTNESTSILNRAGYI